MATPETSAFQNMANALGRYQRVVAENEILQQDSVEVRGWWNICGPMVDGFDDSEPDGMLDPVDRKDHIDDLTARLGGVARVVGNDMIITKKDMVELSFRDIMEDTINTRIKDVEGLLAFRREFSLKHGITAPITSPEWDTEFDAFLTEHGEPVGPSDDFFDWGIKSVVLVDGSFIIRTDEELAELDAAFDREVLDATTDMQQTTNEH